MEIQNHATGMPRTITMKASRLAASENLGMSGMPMTCKSIKKNANFHYEANTIEVTKATTILQKVPILMPKVLKKSTFGTTIGTFLCFSAYFSIFYSIFAPSSKRQKICSKI